MENGFIYVAKVKRIIEEEYIDDESFWNFIKDEVSFSPSSFLRAINRCYELSLISNGEYDNLIKKYEKYSSYSEVKRGKTANYKYSFEKLYQLLEIDFKTDREMFNFCKNTIMWLPHILLKHIKIAFGSSKINDEQYQKLMQIYEIYNKMYDDYTQFISEETLTCKESRISKLEKIIKENYTSDEEFEMFMMKKVKITCHNFLNLIKTSFGYKEFSEAEYRDLIIKYKKYLAYREKKLENIKLKKEEKEVLEEISKLIDIYFNGDFLCIETFLKSINLTLDTFCSYLNKLKKLDYAKYKKFKEIKKQREDLLLQKLQRNVLIMYDQIHNGIVMENGLLRNFDLVDYYELMAIPIDKFESLLIYVCPSDKLKDIREFIIKNKGNNTLETSFIYGQNFRYSCQYDNEGNVIVGSGKIFSNEEKRKVIDFMSKNHATIPFSEEVYSTLIRRRIRKLQQQT